MPKWAQPLASSDEQWFTSSRMPYRATERTEARKAATRERIVAAALDQVAEGGYASASVQPWSPAGPGSPRAPSTATFPSKAELFAEVFRRAAEPRARR